MGQADDDRHGDVKLPTVELLVTVREFGDAADTVCRQSQVDTEGSCTVAVEKSTTKEKWDEPISEFGSKLSGAFYNNAGSSLTD